MPEITDQIQELLARQAELQQSIKDLEAQAVEHEQAARQARAKRAEAKDELAKINLMLRDSRVVAATQSAEAAAKDSQAKAEETLRRLAEKEQELNALLVKARETAEEAKSVEEGVGEEGESV